MVVVVIVCVVAVVFVVVVAVVVVKSEEEILSSVFKLGELQWSLISLPSLNEGLRQRFL